LGTERREKEASELNKGCSAVLSGDDGGANRGLDCNLALAHAEQGIMDLAKEQSLYSKCSECYMENQQGRHVHRSTLMTLSTLLLLPQWHIILHPRHNFNPHFMVWHTIACVAFLAAMWGARVRLLTL